MKLGCHYSSSFRDVAELNLHALASYRSLVESETSHLIALSLFLFSYGLHDAGVHVFEMYINCCFEVFCGLTLVWMIL